MHSNENEFSKPASPPVPYMNNSPDELQIQTHFDGTPNKTTYVTSYNPNRNVSYDNFPDESCDSFIDIEEASVSLPGKSMKNGEIYHQSFMAALTQDENLRQKREQYNPYQRLQLKSVDISSNQELNELIKTVETSKQNNETLTATETTEPVIDLLTSERPRIEILEEPETVIKHFHLIIYIYLLNIDNINNKYFQTFLRSNFKSMKLVNRLCKVMFQSMAL